MRDSWGHPAPGAAGGLYSLIRRCCSVRYTYAPMRRGTVSASPNKPVCSIRGHPSLTAPEVLPESRSPLQDLSVCGPGDPWTGKCRERWPESAELYLVHGAMTEVRR